MKEFEFMPKEVKVKAGATVTWTNAGTTAHSATAIDKAFNTRNLQPGETRPGYAARGNRLPNHAVK
jgi:plastocyanin